jgi:hypothetical protein
MWALLDTSGQITKACERREALTATRYFFLWRVGHWISHCQSWTAQAIHFPRLDKSLFSFCNVANDSLHFYTPPTPRPLVPSSVFCWASRMHPL